MGVIQNTIRYYLDNGYSDRVIVMGLDGSGKTTMMKDLITTYRYSKIYPDQSEVSEESNYILGLYQLYDRFPILDGFIYRCYVKQVNTDTGYTDNFIDEYLNYSKYLIDKYYKNPLFVFYLHDIFIDTKDKSEHVSVLSNRNLIINRYLKIVEKFQKYYPFILVTESSVQMFGKGANYGYKL